MKYLNVFLYSLCLAIASVVAAGEEVKVNYDYRYNFDSFYSALNSHAPKNKVIFAKFGENEMLLVCEDLETDKLFLFCPVSVGVMKIYDVNMEVLNQDEMISSFSLVPGSFHKGDGTVENDFDISEKELSGYWINKKEKPYFLKIRWQPTNEKQNPWETVVKIYKNNEGIWVAHSQTPPNK